MFESIYNDLYKQQLQLQEFIIFKEKINKEREKYLETSKATQKQESSISSTR